MVENTRIAAWSWRSSSFGTALGLYPRKGTVAVGSDADFVVFDPNRKHVITATSQHSRSDYNPRGDRGEGHA